MKIEYIDINKLKLAEYNPRKLLVPEDDEFVQIQSSIDVFGMVEPIILNKDFTVIGGHQRINVYKFLGWTEIPCFFVDLDKIQEKKLNLVLNKITGKWDDEKLYKILDYLKLDNEDFSNLGFSEDEFKKLEDKFKEIGGSADDYNEDFPSLEEGEKTTPSVMSFTFSNEQAEIIKNVLSEIKTEDIEDNIKLGNTNDNGNKLFYIINDWKEGPFKNEC